MTISARVIEPGTTGAGTLRIGAIAATARSSRTITLSLLLMLDSIFFCLLVLTPDAEILMASRKLYPSRSVKTSGSRALR